MTPLFKKLNFKEQPEILILNAPASFEEEVKDMSLFARIHEEVGTIQKIEFCMIFVKQKEEINQSIKAVSPIFEGDVILWYCYPKKSSKKYSCDFNRDNGWDALGELNFEGVRQVSIDEDWSALRFRKIEYIKTLKRSKSRIISKEGKKRTT